MTLYKTTLTEKGLLVKDTKGNLRALFPEGVSWYYDYLTQLCITRTPPYNVIPKPLWFSPY